MALLIDDVYLRGGGLGRDLISACTAASLSGSMGQISQLEMTFTDPGWKLLQSGIFSINASVDIETYQLEIAAISTGNDVGIENVTVKCRPRVIRKLKDRRGTRVLKNASPSDFIISECKAVGAKYKVQGSADRTQVARDVPASGTQEVDSPPSSWTTFNRFADELGYVVFESNSTIYFGRPSFFISEGAINKTFLVYRYKEGPDDDWRMYDVPSATRSADSPGQTVDMTVRVPTATRISTGLRVNVSGVPTFQTNYLVTKFSLDLLDPRKLCGVQLGVAMNPDASSDGGGQPHRGTRTVNDFLYWVEKQFGNTYVSNTQVALGSFDPNAFDGDELVQWAAAQVGVYMPEGPNDQIEYCQSNGTLITVDGARKQRGAILWRNNHIAISFGNNDIVESVNGKVGLRKGGSGKYTRAGKIPGLLY